MDDGINIYCQLLQNIIVSYCKFCISVRNRVGLLGSLNWRMGIFLFSSQLKV